MKIKGKEKVIVAKTNFIKTIIDFIAPKKE